MYHKFLCPLATPLIQPTEINCVPKYTVARRYGRSTVWYFCEKSNGISVITFNWVICINVGAPRQGYQLRARAKNKNPTSYKKRDIS